MPGLMTAANYPQSTEENIEAQERPQTIGIGLVPLLSSSQARALLWARRMRDIEPVGRVGRLVLQVASDLPFLPAWLCWPGMWPWLWQVWCRDTPDWAAPIPDVLPGGKGPPSLVLPWVEGAAGALGTLLHPPGLRLCSQRAGTPGSKLPEQATNCRAVPAADSGLCQAARGGAGGMRELLFPLFVSRWESTASH